MRIILEQYSQEIPVNYVCIQMTLREECVDKESERTRQAESIISVPASIDSKLNATPNNIWKIQNGKTCVAWNDI